MKPHLDRATAAPTPAPAALPAAAPIDQAPSARPEPAAAPAVPFDLDRHRAETERLRVLVEFLGRPVHAPGGSDPDPDILTAYNLAVEAALQGVRQAAARGLQAG
jgi:hypothetical protein